MNFCKMTASLFLIFALEASAQFTLVCPANNLGFALYADQDKINITYNGDVIKTWQHPRRDWDGHKSGMYDASSPDHISIYYANSFGINRNVSAHCRIDNDGRYHYRHLVWDECNNINDIIVD